MRGTSGIIALYYGIVVTLPMIFFALFGINSTSGVEDTPKSPTMINYSERGKTVTSPCAMHGKPTIRQADRRNSYEMLEKANAIM